MARTTREVRSTRGRRRAWGSFPTTADVGIWARGGSADALLEGLGLGLSAILTDLRRVRRREDREVDVAADDPTELVVAFLNELIVLTSAEGFLVRDLTVTSSGDPPTSLVATATGETIDPARHVLRTEVKAATFHELRFEPARHRARVIVDI